MSAPDPIRNWTALASGTDPTPETTIRQWRCLLGLGPSSLYKARTRLLHQSSRARTVYLIETGIVKLSHVSADDREIALLLRFPGDLVGAYGSLLQLPHFVSATAVTDCRLFELPSGTVMKALHANAGAACFLSQRQTVDAVRIQFLLMEARLLSAEQRFFRLLLQIATATGSVRASYSRVSVSVPLSEAEIADLIPMNRTAFSRLKRTLIRKGDLEQDKNIFSFARRLAENEHFYVVP